MTSGFVITVKIRLFNEEFNTELKNFSKTFKNIKENIFSVTSNYFVNDLIKFSNNYVTFCVSLVTFSGLWKTRGIRFTKVVDLTQPWK